MLTFLSGGTGTPKLLMGMQKIMPRDEICVIANTAEDVVVSNTYISPDIDSVMYALAGVIDTDKWYGIRNDTFHTHRSLVGLGYKELLKMGDKDRATKLYRTMRLAIGDSLTSITQDLCERFGVVEHIFPMSDDRVKTVIHTEEGPMTFHEFWVRDNANHKVDKVDFIGSEKASLHPETKKFIKSSEAIVIGPSNPITSILPILSIKGINKLCIKKHVVAISPLIGNKAFSGPAATLMSGLGFEVTPLGLFNIYDDLLNEIFIDNSDSKYKNELEKKGVITHTCDLSMKDLNNSISLGKNILNLLVVD